MKKSESSLRMSVVVNNYNYGRYVDECILSVLNQSRPADEIIFVDDGSTDDSVEIIQRYESDVKILSQPNGGQLSAVMTGVEAATGDIVILLDSDDVWEASHLSVVEKAFETTPSIDCLFTSLQMFGDVEGPHSLNCRDFPHWIKCSRLIVLYLNTFFGRPTSACSFRRPPIKKVLEACKGLEDEFKICADMLLIHGSSLLGMEKMFVGDCTVRYRAHGSNGYHPFVEGEKEMALRAHRKGLVVKRMRDAYPFNIDASAVVDEMRENANSHLHHVFYRKIPNRMPLSWLGNKTLGRRLRRLRRVLERGD